VGWADTYGSYLAGQAINIEGLPDGEYCVAVTGDPSDIVRESNELNNEALTPVTLTGGSVTNSGDGCDLSPPPTEGGEAVIVSQAARGETGARCKKATKKKRKTKNRTKRGGKRTRKCRPS
jgi:hypothetical protein